MPPFRVLIDGGIGERAQGSDNLAVSANADAGDLCFRRLVHERHKLVRETRHRAADADASDVWASPDASHPAALRHVAIDYRAPAAQFHDALRGTVDFSKIRLFLVTSAVSSIVDRRTEEPLRP